MLGVRPAYRLRHMRASPKRAVSVKIEDFPRRDQDLLRAAFHAWVPMVLVGFKDEKPFVIALGHPEGLATAEASPDESRIYSLKRIKGVDKPAPDAGRWERKMSRPLKFQGGMMDRRGFMAAILAASSAPAIVSEFFNNPKEAAYRQKWQPPVGRSMGGTLPRDSRNCGCRATNLFGREPCGGNWPVY